MQATNPARQFSGKTQAARAVAALVAVAACFLFASNLRADQTDAEAIAILTRYSWSFDANRPDHLTVFAQDGTFTFYRTGAAGNLVNIKAYSGTWTISNGTVTFKNNDGNQFVLNPPIDPNGTHGINSAGQPMIGRRTMITPPPAGSPQTVRARPQPPATATPTPYVSSETQQSASAIIQAHHDSLVFVNGAAAAGSGFIASMNGGNFLVTNAHVTAGIRDASFKTLDGTAVQAGVPSAAVGEDIFCMAMPPGGTPFEVMQQVDANAAVGDDVVVLGNAEGGGVINTIIGKIVGIGPNLIEVDAPFVPGNSGSPIIHLKSGKVIGVATYLVTNHYDLATDEQLAQPIVRRFGYRLDTVKGWQQVDWRSFYAQAAEMDRIETLTTDLYDFFRDLIEHKGVLTPGRHTNPIIKNRIDDWIEQKGSHPSPEDAAEADASFLSFLKTACQSDVNAAQGQITYDYFRRDLADQKQTRDEMAKAFQQIIQSVGP